MHMPIPAVRAAVPADRTGRGTRVPDMPRLLAVLAARQRVLPTAGLMRGHERDLGSHPADRMVRLFVTRAFGGISAGGAFNGGVADYLVGTEEGEGGVYRGA